MAARHIRNIAFGIAGAAVAGLVLVTPAQADPIWPGGPDIPGIPQLVPPPAPGQPLLPPPAPQSTLEQPGLAPANGEVVGGKRAVDVVFRGPVQDRQAAEKSVTVTSNPGTAGHFEWVDDSHLKWVPDDYWARGTQVTVNASGVQSAFAVSDTFDAVADAGSHRFIAKIGGDVVRDVPASLGKPGHESPNGTFPVMSREADVTMDSSTYGVPVNSPEGYKVDVKWATRLTSDGIYVHAAPWSVKQQGNSNVSHGCINLSDENAKWFFDTVRNGDKVTIQNA